MQKHFNFKGSFIFWWIFIVLKIPHSKKQLEAVYSHYFVGNAVSEHCRGSPIRINGWHFDQPHPAKQAQKTSYLHVAGVCPIVQSRFLFWFSNLDKLLSISIGHSYHELNYLFVYYQIIKLCWLLICIWDTVLQTFVFFVCKALMSPFHWKQFLLIVPNLII